MNTITGIKAVEFLNTDAIKTRVKLHKKDNTNKMWSYKLKIANKSEFAFDPKTKKGLYVWFDSLPPEIEGIVAIENISIKRNRTALDRVFSGGIHKAKYKATIQTKEALAAVINHLESGGERSLVENEFTYADDIQSPGLVHREGAKKAITVNAFERSAAARNACVEHYGASCLGCGFNFADEYGSEGEGYIHVHHIVPLETISEEYIVNPMTDLIPLCPNCHAMTHKRNPPYTLAELHELINNA